MDNKALQQLWSQRLGRTVLLTNRMDWTAEQVVDFMMDSMANGDFYILCPDNDVSRETDNKRIRWAAEDIIQNRPPLSRWHPDYREAFERFEP